ncbi:SDR family NAD(P)-dependent oxidoreductase [Saccharococcus sp. Marseille-Q5394]|uniref:SDR family NAD(P)-dependent oxidoreductase n=1 Tax=Saccharococcus sp. Marseille-Q5394 TaxID=2972778 RepID=UPI0021CA3C54|nr:SDR family oxidoreductase [Saccharococcus sp. Marseille-Q5394]
MGLLDGKVAIITGATGGIGRSVAEKFVSEGAKVALADIADKAGEELSSALGDYAIYVHTDVSKEEDVANLVTTTVEKFGKLDVMYNNAGIVGAPESMLEVSPDEYDKVLTINARSVLMGHKYAGQQFRKQGTNGSIITTASVAGIQGGWSTVAYTASKHTAAGIVRQSAYELGPFGIRSNAIAPGVVMTNIQARAFGVPLEYAREFNEYIIEHLGKKQAMGRFGLTDDIAGVATFLASDLSSYVNGQVIPVDGGASAMTQNTFDKDILEVTSAFREKKGLN